ncbi:putative siderophore-binding lipoprotein YfiY precursor [Vibrio aerogenes CECT 7868]|uniref:Putative siderophore-binding lipoprotein YfiY n=1 Tax=Vibrio aerogenes CECT 7868 TaxID=1216006 RepID=A0A1M5UGP8_9VIBR|nr:iron-siderophore ABC transporter substrate-binding protein [Vibrio aerogenes]SHH62159.1 putative siderophore-binding lipoprotein YfiY precursor [Vibrio aerogenes CECT 7868]
MLSFRHTLIHSMMALSVCFSSLALADVTVNTKYGQVTVPDHPQKIVTLYEGALDTMTAVQVKVAGSITTRGGEGVADYIADKAGNVAIVATGRETNIEAVLAQRPDVIMAPYYLSESQYKILSKIAPTLVPDFDRTSPDLWEKEARFYAGAVGKTPQINQVLTAIHQQETELKQAIEAKIPSDQRTTIVARWMPQGPIIMADYLFAGTLLKAVGLHPSDAGLLKKGRPHSSPLSLENLSAIDADRLFLVTLNNDGKSALDAAKSSPAFSRLNVVKNNRVTLADGQVWSSATGPVAAQVILRDIHAAVLGQTH